MVEEYGIFFDSGGVTIRLPVNPSEFTEKTKSGNKTYELVNLGEINVQKSIPLRELSFKSFLPNNPNYPFVLTKNKFEYPIFYINKFREYKENKIPIRFIVTRKTNVSESDMETNMLVTIEDFTFTESAGTLGEWDYSINLKEYREYGSRTLTAKKTSNKNTATKIVKAEINRPSNKQKNKSYTVKKNDSLWSIAKKELNDGSKYIQLYNLNKTTIDKKNKGTGNSKYTIHIGQVLKLE